MSFDQLNEDWQQEFQEIPVPTAKLDALLAEALQETAPQQKTRGQVRRFPARKKWLPLLTTAALLLLTLGIGKAYLDQQTLMNQPTLGGVTEPASDQATEQDTPEDAVTADPTTERISYHYQLTQETTDFKATLTALQKLITSHQGFIENSNILQAQKDQEASGSFTIRIPETEKEAFFTDLRELAPVVAEQQESTDLTKSYQDTDSRLKALAAEETALLQLLEKADRMDNMLAIQNRLTDIRSERESLVSQQKQLAEAVTYSTIQLDIHEISQAQAAQNAPKAGTRIKNNWQQQWAFWQTFLTNAGIWLASNFLYLILLGIGGYLGWRKWQKHKGKGA